MGGSGGAGGGLGAAGVKGCGAAACGLHCGSVRGGLCLSLIYIYIYIYIFFLTQSRNAASSASRSRVVSASHPSHPCHIRVISTLSAPDGSVAAAGSRPPHRSLRGAAGRCLPSLQATRWLYKYMLVCMDISSIYDYIFICPERAEAIILKGCGGSQYIINI
jgi:hypothetical protein